MKFGLTQSQHDFLKNALLPLKSCGATLWCFGSRARGDHKLFSDIDIMVESDRDLTATIGLVKESLEQSNFPFKVDIVQASDFSPAYKAGFDKDKIAFL